MLQETETQIRLRRAKEALSFARNAEMIARINLNDAVESTRKAKERYENLFFAAEKEACEKLKSEYIHTIK